MLIAGMGGVTEVSPILLTGTNVEGVLPTVYTVGVENDPLVKSRYNFEENLGENEVIISQKIASLFDKAVGDTIDIEFAPYVIKEILHATPRCFRYRIIILSNATVKQWINFNMEDAVGLFTLIDLSENMSAAYYK